MPRPFSHLHPQAGYSLLEISVVLAIIAIVTTATLSMGSSMIESARRVNTHNKLDAIETALMAFRLANNRLPCPGDETLTEHASGYGYEADNTSGTCTGGWPSANFSYTVAANTPSAAAGTTVAEGAVPVKALGLPDEFQFDGWGRKFAYAVWTPLTSTDAFITYGVSPNCGAIAVENAGHGYRTTDGAYALVSYGPNGHGGYLENGQRYFMGSDNADEWTNCHCNASADTSNYAATYVEQDATQTNPNDPNSAFDDIVRFKDRWQMQNAYDTYVPNGAFCVPGFRIDGQYAGDTLGKDYGSKGVAVADFNGDGIPDLIFTRARSDGVWLPSVYVLYGSRYGFTDPSNVSSLNGANGFEIDFPDMAGYETSVAVADVNGDGYPDLIVGSTSASTDGLSSNGVVYVVFGHPGPWPATTSFSTLLDGTHAIRLDGAASNDYAGMSVAAGDVNGDRVADILIGANQSPYNYGAQNGKAYLIFGGANILPKTTVNTSGGSNSVTVASAGGMVVGQTVYSTNIPFGTTITAISGTTLTLSQNATATASGTALAISTTPLNFVNGTNGAEIDGGASTGSPDLLGTSVAIGDVDRDGYGDLILGAPSANMGRGATYVVFGHGGAWTSPMTLAVPDGTTYARIDGSSASPPDDSLGVSVATGDVNGDGIADIVLGAYGSNSTYPGRVDAVFGHARPWSATTNLSTLNGSNGFALQGQVPGEMVGTSVAAADVNGDGIADIIAGTGCGWNGNSTPGNVYVVFGHSGAWPSSANLDSTLLDGNSGFELLGGGTATGCIGTSVTAGNLTGNGYGDIIAAAPWNSANGLSGSGSIYVYYGKKGGWPPTYNLSNF